MKKNEGYICVFDCESIIDVELVRKLYGFDGDDYEVSKQMLKAYKDENDTEFLPLPFHKIVSICATLCDSFASFIKVDKISGDDEKTLISNFFKIIEDYEPRLVSFNGKNYDMPLLVLRALKYNIKASAYLSQEDKWNNYKTRYSEIKHCDLLESLGAFSLKGLKLDTICSMANLPGKYDVNGSDVLSLYYENQLEKIHEYCESDTLNTYMLFLKYELIKGNLNDGDYKHYLGLMSEYLSSHKKHRAYSDIFIKACEREVLT
ncbi:3'-5' exonuclease [uncultured Campylobacter sp.]|uniref:3'-5' exonuclease n=1 Tax=uncultured Campylobacter sp. TaxID=218934 RepID=UPI0026371DC8|nr:3'-5' exonuclease [uncultured Campylobacter sp.]